MLDIKFVRENPDAVKENIKKKFQDAKLPLVDEVIEKDAKYRAALKEVDQEDGETERAFLITAGRQKRSCMSVCIRENRDIRAIRCGSLPIN